MYQLCTRLRFCPTGFQVEKVPAFAVSCSLWNVEANSAVRESGHTQSSWDEGATKLFSELVSSCKVQVMIRAVHNYENETPAVPARNVYANCFVTVIRNLKANTWSDDCSICVSKLLFYFNYALPVEGFLEDVKEC